MGQEPPCSFDMVGMCNRCRSSLHRDSLAHIEESPGGIRQMEIFLNTRRLLHSSTDVIAELPCSAERSGDTRIFRARAVELGIAAGSGLGEHRSK